MKLLSKINILLVMFFLSITGCQVAGTYTWYAYNTKIDFMLNKDGSFVEEISLNHQSDTFRGRWEMSKDTVIREITSPPIHFSEDSEAVVEELSKGSPDSIYFKVFLDGEQSNSFPSIYFNGSPSGISPFDSTGNTALLRDDTYSFCVLFFIGPMSVRHKIKDSSANFFIIHAHSKEYAEKAMRIDPTLKFLRKGNKLLFLDYQNALKKNQFYKKKLLLWPTKLKRWTPARKKRGK